MITPEYQQAQDLAIFDMDHTLVDADTPMLWFQFMDDKGIVPSGSLDEGKKYFNQQYLAGTLEVDEYLAFELGPLLDKPFPLLNEWRQEFVETYVAPKITQKAKDWMRLHRLAGETMILATASNQFVAEGVSEFLGFSHLICTELEVKNGFYTGKKIGQSSFQGGKLTRMHSWIADNGGSLDRASFYSDSHNDLPLLEAVRSPIVVDPDDKLRQHAENLGWKIISKY